MRLLFVYLFFSFVFDISTSFATVIHVPAQQSTIQNGVSAALSGDTVLVAPGIYVETVNLHGKAILLISSAGRELTSIRAANSGGAVVCNSGEDTTTVIDGFTINGAAFARGITCVESSPVIQNCEITNCNGGTDGGGIYCYNSAAKIRHNLIHNNTVTATGSGICVNAGMASGVEISHNEMYNSLGTGEAIGCLYVTGVYIHHNLIRDNTVDFWAAGAIYLNGGTDIRIINNTIVDNTHAVVTYGSPQTLVLNNIIVNNSQVAVPSNLPQVDYNDIWGNGSPSVGGSHGISEDPQFTDPASNDFTLQPSSPCVNAGHPDPQYADPDGSRNDMGAFPMTLLQESPYASNLKIMPRNQDGSVASLTPSFAWTYIDTSGLSQTAYWIQVGTDDEWSAAENWDSGPVASIDTSAQFSGWPLEEAGIYWVRVRVSNGTTWGGWRELRFILRASRTIRVPRHQPTIQAGINASTDGDTVLVAPGTYLEHISLWGRRIVLTTEQGPLGTIIRPTFSSAAVITCNSGEGTSTVIEGFTVDGASYNRGVYCLNSSPIIQQCEIRNCGGSTDGSGVYCVMSSGIIRHNKIYSNAAIATGSGICVAGTSALGVEIGYNEFYDAKGQGQAIGLLSATKTNIHHNVFHDNTVNHWSAGAVYLNDSREIRVINNTIVNNTHAITIYASQQPVVRNNIIVGCSQAALPTGLTQSDYNDIWNCPSGNFPGPNGISLDPKFESPTEFIYLLLPESPCRDAGDPDPQYNDPDGSRNDMGAFWGTVRDPYVKNLRIDGEDRSHVRTQAPMFAWTYSTIEVHPLDSIEFEVGRDYDWAVAELWSTGPIAHSATSIIYDGQLLHRGSLYSYRLRVHDGVDWSEWAQSSFKLNSLPEVPALRQPINFVMTGQVPLFKVKTFGDFDNDVIKVDFTICSDSELTHELIGLDRTSITSYDSISSWQPTNSFVENGGYYWSARTWDGYETSAWAPPTRIWYNNIQELPGQFAISYPPMITSDAIPTLTPILIWDRSIDPDPQDTLRYQIDIAADSAFMFLFSQDNIVDTTYHVVNPLQVNRRYWWRVAVTDQTGMSSMTGEGSFWTWMQGDVDLSRRIDLSDLSMMIAFLVAGQAEGMPDAVGDLNGDCRVDLSDLSMLITYMTGTRVDFASPCVGTDTPLQFRAVTGSLSSGDTVTPSVSRPGKMIEEVLPSTRKIGASSKGGSR